MTKVFPAARARLALTVLAAAGGVAALTACQGSTTTYAPAPRYTTQPGGGSCGAKCGAKTAPPPATVPQPVAPAGGQMSCGKGGKCG